MVAARSLPYLLSVMMMELEIMVVGGGLQVVRMRSKIRDRIKICVARYYTKL